MRLITILYAEDDQTVRHAVKETLELEGWHVEAYADGTTTLAKIESSEHYDLILMDDGLPGVSGLELTRRARGLTHRQHTPIIMLSAGRLKREARRAGANAFLEKPDEMNKVVETIKRLLPASTRE